MADDIKLVDLAILRRLVETLDLKDPARREYLEARWLKYVEWWDSRAWNAKWRYFTLRSAVVIGGALIPALVGLRELNVWARHAWIFSLASIVASLVVAICAGLESLFGFGDIWREKRKAAELIKSEGFRFFQLIGDYSQPDKTHADLYPAFAENVERIIQGEIGDYVLAVAPKPPK